MQYTEKILCPVAVFTRKVSHGAGGRMWDEFYIASMFSRELVISQMVLICGREY